MCGISLLLDPAGTPGNRERLIRMHDRARHRGPDGEGALVVDQLRTPRRWESAAEIPGGPPLRLGVAFRRLKVIDLSEAAAQPMASPDLSTWIVSNGEIYNFRELRAELAARGRVFRSSGDTEVALAAFEAWGEEAFRRLEGMWAMAIVDLRQRRIVLSRDRFGIKPLYWARAGGALLVASEVKQILAASGERPSAHPASVRRFLTGDRLPCLENTFFEGIQALPPASWTSIPLDAAPVGEPAFRRYWELPPPQCAPQPYAESVETLRGLLAEVVASHDVADVALGSLLSGGLDSAAIVSLLAPRRRARGRACPTFSFGIPDAGPALGELGYVDTMVRQRDLVNHRTGFDAAWAAENAPRMVYALEEPPLGMAALAQHRVFQLCREHGVTVAFDGQGADEVFAGYPYHQRMLLADRARRRRVRELVGETRAIARREGRGVLAVCRDAFAPLLAARLPRRPAWLDPVWGRDAAFEREATNARAERHTSASLVDGQLRYDVGRGNARVMLAYTDGAAMAHSVEARVPYFDRRLVEFAFSLPDVYKVGAGERKRILRDAARGLVPPEITERRDRLGFGVPERALLHSLWPSVRATILEDGIGGWPCFVPGTLMRLVDDFEAGRHEEARPLWRLYVLGLWARAFEPRLI